MAKQVTYEIDNIEELQKAFPELVTDKHVVEKIIDKPRLYQAVKFNHSLGRTIPGITITSPPVAQTDIEGLTDPKASGGEA